MTAKTEVSNRRTFDPSPCQVIRTTPLVDWYEDKGQHYIVYGDVVLACANVQVALKWWNKLTGEGLKWTQV